MATTTVKLLGVYQTPINTYRVGQLVELKAEEADRLIGLGLAEPHPPPTDETTTDEKDEEN